MLRRLPSMLATSAVVANRGSMSLRSTRCLSSRGNIEWERKKKQRPINISDDYVATDSAPNMLERAGSFFKGLSVDFASSLQKMPAFFTREAAFERELYRQKMQRLSSQKFFAERHGILGADLAAASFLVFRGALVKFHGKDEWFMKKKDDEMGLPIKYEPGWVIEAIDAANAELYYEGLDNLTCLEGLKTLRLAGNPNVDDWFLDRLSQFKETLEHLDISGCPQITEHGLAVLYRLRKLKTITLGHLSHVKHLKLVGLMLEEAIPGCRVLGINYIDSDASSEQAKDSSSKEAHQKPQERPEQLFPSAEKTESNFEGSETRSAAKQST
ncbi:distal membrane-arm assembly complex protein 2 [Dermacentor andersoni]|uniref:distal membrane-arm assembly complex protein 2 n=1 Tax=Dermacentor andersoni TaxID=34620 RepID=UPI002155A0B6|nr:distal membrane-arm assembly complex protein 2-like [Dermacentor andersoni]